MNKIQLVKYLRDPSAIVDYYSFAFKRPSAFVESIDFDEDLVDSGLVFAVAMLLLVVLSSLVDLSLTGFFYSIVLAPLGLAIVAAITYFISLVCKAQFSIKNSINLCIHTTVLFLPISIAAVFISLLSILGFLGQLFFWGYCLLEVGKADLKRLLIASALGGLLIVLPLTCSLLAMNTVMSPGISGISEKKEGVFKMLDSFQKANDLSVPCMKKYEESDNPHWQSIVFTSQAGIALSIDESEDNTVARNLVVHIDKVLAKRNHKMSRGQVKCLRIFQDSIKNKFL